MVNRLKPVAGAVLAAALLTGCGSAATQAMHTSTGTQTRAASGTSAAGSAAAAPESGHASIAIRNYMFSPMHLVVTAGTKVSFHNGDQTNHTATALNRAFDTGTIAPGKTATVTFAKPGTYAYHCLFHAFMTATIKVVAASKG